MITRHVAAITSAMLITLLLLAVMTSLIKFRPVTPGTDRPRAMLLMARVIEETNVIRDFSPPAPPPPIPPNPTSNTEMQELGTGPRLNALHPPQPPEVFTPAVGINDGPIVALVRVAPVYPTRAITNGAEGWVLVEYDVTASGGVTNVRVVESSHRMFEAAAVRAAKKFRYKPRVVDGRPRLTRGVRNRFRFEMERIA